ncbi:MULTISPECIES: hypothetical protein [unclassified Pseudomonas]|uniref:hypothetical protein n=1 Tax=unclassified Pseudomonas TaxID=196821 RepID=UPI0025E038FE|nr:MULTISPECIES: hypothetical protein [unclassified Pseudomonas]
MTLKKLLLSSEEVQDSGQQLLQGSGNFTVPNGVTSISVLVVEGGQPGSPGGSFDIGSGGTGGSGGLGGRRRYINNVSVTPGQVIAYSIAARAASFGSIITGTTGGTDAGKAGDGGGSANTGSLQTSRNNGGVNGGPTSIYDAEIGYDFFSVASGSGISPKAPFPGGGGGGGAAGVNLQGSTEGLAGGAGGEGAIVVVWPGSQRSFPRTRTVPEITNTAIFDPRSLPPYLGKIATDGSGTYIGIDISNIAGRRGRIFRSTDNGRTFNLVGTPRDEQLADVVYIAGTWVIAAFALSSVSRYQFQKSTDGGLTWSYYVSAGGASGSVVGISARSGRLFILCDEISTQSYIATSQDLGVTLTNRSFSTSSNRAASVKQSRFIHLSDTVLLARQGNAGSAALASFISRDNGVSWAPSVYLEAAKLGNLTLAFTQNGNINNLYVSTDDLNTVTQVPGFSFTAKVFQRALIPLQDRILIVDGPLSYEYRNGVISPSTRLPIDIPVSNNIPANNAGLRVVGDGVDAIVSFVQESGSANFRASVYVS